MFLKKSKDANKFRIIDDISEFSKEDFEKYELYDIQPIQAGQFDEIVRTRKIEELKKELAKLGVTMGSPMHEAAMPQNQASMPQIGHLQASAHRQPSNGMSLVKKANSDEFFSMVELRNLFNIFREQIEKDIPEIRFSAVDEKGFMLSMTEFRNDIPKVLPNGIPIVQKVEGS